MSEQPGRTWLDFLDYLAARFVQVVDRARLDHLQQLDRSLALHESRLVVERLLDQANPLLNLMERERAIDEVLDILFGLGPLGAALHFDRVEEIEVDGPGAFQVRPEMTDCFTPIRSLEQLYLICTRLLGAEPAPGSLVEREVENFWLTARFPASRQEPPTLHFRRLRPAQPAVELPPPRLPAEEQRVFVAFVQACHAAGLDERSDEALLRPLALQTIDKLRADAPESTRTRLVDTMLAEFRHE